MVTFGWDLCNTCNYRCPYCGIWERVNESCAVQPVERWEKIWGRIFDLYGRCKIFVSGGEPSTYPDFYALVRMLAKKHLPEICTNLSWDVSRLVPELAPDRLRIAPTFHPSFADFEVFFNKVLRVKEYLPDAQVYYVAAPNQIADMPARSERLKREGIKLIPNPLRGDGFVLNSAEEKKIIEALSPYKGTEKMEYQLNTRSPEGKLCRAGMAYAVIRTDGSVNRCSQYTNEKVGNILDEDFCLLAKPSPCGKTYCPIESQWIVS